MRSLVNNVASLLHSLCLCVHLKLAQSVRKLVKFSHERTTVRLANFHVEKGEMYSKAYLRTRTDEERGSNDANYTII